MNIGRAAGTARASWHKKGSAWGQAGEVLQCDWAQVPKGVVWEQMKLKRKQGPDPT